MSGAALVGCSRSEQCGEADSGAPTCGHLWGVTLPAANSKLPAAVAAEEASTDRGIDVVHTYHRWFDTFPTPSERALAQSGHHVFIDWAPVNPSGGPMSWRAIANGAGDTEIDALAARLAGLPTIWLSFSHEPELNWGTHGNAADFVAAFRHIHDRLENKGVRNVRFVWNVMGLTQQVWLDRYSQLWPGSSYVDWIAWDPYNWEACRSRAWQSFTQTVGPFYDWLGKQSWADKPLMLAEYGTVEKSGDPGGKAAWLASIPAALKDLPKLKALVYFDLDAPPANCNWSVDTSAASLAAFGVLARSDAFRRVGASGSTGGS